MNDPLRSLDKPAWERLADQVALDQVAAAMSPEPPLEALYGRAMGSYWMWRRTTAEYRPMTIATRLLPAHEEAPA